jgi:hypothetical protein
MIRIRVNARLPRPTFFALALRACDPLAVPLSVTDLPVERKGRWPAVEHDTHRQPGRFHVAEHLPRLRSRGVAQGGRTGLGGVGQRHGWRLEPKANGHRVRRARVLPAAERLFEVG